MKNKQNLSVTKGINKNKLTKITKSKLEWVILAVLILLIAMGVWSNLFTFEYYYFKCGDKPLEVEGKYYRIPNDKGYGIHHGSNYSICSYSKPPGVQRDPLTKAGAALAKSAADEANGLSHLATDYNIYMPNGYKTSQAITSGQGDNVETVFSITTNAGRTFSVREMTKDSPFSYTNLCSKPAEVNWSGTVIGHDDKGRQICRTNISKYVPDYVVGVNIGKTAIMLKAPDTTSAELLNADAIAIFGSMELYSGQ